MSNDLRHDIFVINDITNREEILEFLNGVYTDEDFNGNNGEEYISESALEEGFNSMQEYIVEYLCKETKLTGIELIKEFYKEWIDNYSGNYYDDYSIEYLELDNNKVVLSIAIVY